jgi:hypothetical protein
VDVQIHIFLTSTLDKVEWLVSRPGIFTPGTHWTGGCVEPKAGVDDVEEIQFLNLPGIEIRTSVVQPVASRYTDYDIPVPSSIYITNKNCLRNIR